jgi:hypothetical protein
MSTWLEGRLGFCCEVQLSSPYNTTAAFMLHTLPMITKPNTSLFVKRQEAEKEVQALVWVGGGVWRSVTRGRKIETKIFEFEFTNFEFSTLYGLYTRLQIDL